MYEPVHLKRWTLPRDYFGAHWPDYYAFLGRSRDSDPLERANFDAGLRAIGGERTADDGNETPLVLVVNESHWAVGWVEWIAIHESAVDALKAADEVMKELEEYPVVDEELWSAYETEEANEVWSKCMDVKERIAYVRRYRSQFDFRDFADMLGCVRGNYFCGYADELLG